MDLEDATLIILSESAAHPDLAKLAQSAYDQLARDGQVDYRILSVPPRRTASARPG
jgi:hypothetical protein